VGLSAPNEKLRPTGVMRGEKVLAAAVQFEPRIADLSANLARAQQLVRQAANCGARLVILPEFFTTGMGFEPQLAHCVLPPDGPATELLCQLAREHRLIVGGSFLCTNQAHDPDDVRNAFVLAGPDGVLGRHDKDIPTMWEHAFYAGGNDNGLLATEPRFGVALCWELMRRPTAARLRGRVDCVIGGSAWWSTPQAWWSKGIGHREADNATRTAPAIARLVGAPVVHGALCGTVECRLLGSPLRYRGRYEGGSVICDATGNILAARPVWAGDGFALAEIELRGTPPLDSLPSRYWLHRRGATATAVWHYQGWRGRRWRTRNARLAQQFDSAGSGGRAPGRTGALGSHSGTAPAGGISSIDHTSQPGSSQVNQADNALL